MSRARDQFIASVHVLKNRPKLLKELVEEVGRQKKSGDLKAEDCDAILKVVGIARGFSDVVNKRPALF
jgi:hypothetical protein